MTQETKQRCPYCEGKGRLINGNRCPCCEGFGLVGETGLTRAKAFKALDKKREKEGYKTPPDFNIDDVIF